MSIIKYVILTYYNEFVVKINPMRPYDVFLNILLNDYSVQIIRNKFFFGLFLFHIPPSCVFFFDEFTTQIRNFIIFIILKCDKRVHIKLYLLNKFKNKTFSSEISIHGEKFIYTENSSYSRHEFNFGTF